MRQRRRRRGKVSGPRRGYQASAYLNWAASRCNCKQCASHRCNSSQAGRQGAAAAASVVVMAMAIFIPLAANLKRTRRPLAQERWPTSSMPELFLLKFQQFAPIFIWACTKSASVWVSLSLCMCCSLWAIYCATNVQLIAGEITRILPKHIKRLRRQTCLSFCWLHDQKT